MISSSHISIALLIGVTSFLFAVLLVPQVIKLVHKYGLLDVSNYRKLHTTPTPSMGGLAIVGVFITLCVGALFFMSVSEWRVIVLNVIILSAIGFFNDWKDIQVTYKLGAQIALGIIVFTAGYRINYGFGIAGMYELPLWVSFVFTMVFIILVMNAFNLIDGIDGLAGGICLMNFLVFGIVFLLSREFGYTLFCFILVGAVAGFLKYNLNPAKIFMGDTGSLPLGMLMAIFSLKMLDVLALHPQHSNAVNSFLPLVIAMNLLPVFDTLRVFILRMNKGLSPFTKDENHFHHHFLENRLNHKESSSTIHVAHVTLISISLTIGTLIDAEYAAGMLVISAFITFEITTFLRIRIAKLEQMRLKEEEANYLRSNRFLINVKKAPNERIGKAL